MKLKIIIFAFALVYLLSAAQPIAAANEQFDTVETYEKNMFLPGFDIWVNQTGGSALFALSAVSDVSTSNRLVHYMILPDSISMDDLIINDPNVRIRFIFGGTSPQTQNGIQLQKEVSEAGLTSYSSRDTSRTNAEPVDEILQEDAAVVIDTQYSHFNESNFNTLTHNYTVPQTTVTGVQYVADDSKSALDYAKEISEADGATFLNIVNASMIGFGFDNTFDQLEGVTWAFDEKVSVTAISAPPATGSVTQDIFSLKRARVWLHNSAYKAKKFTGAVGRSVSNTVFKPIKNVGKSLAAIPSKAAQFFTKTIPKAFRGAVSKVGSIAKGIVGAVRGLLPILLIGLAVIAFVYFGGPSLLMRRMR